MIQFTIPGAVIAQNEFSQQEKNTIDPPKSRSYKEVVKLAWQHKPQEPILEPIRLEVDVYLMPLKNITQSQSRLLSHRVNYDQLQSQTLII